MVHLARYEKQKSRLPAGHNTSTSSCYVSSSCAIVGATVKLVGSVVGCERVWAQTLPATWPITWLDWLADDSAGDLANNLTWLIGWRLGRRLGSPVGSRQDGWRDSWKDGALAIVFRIAYLSATTDKYEGDMCLIRISYVKKKYYVKYIAVSIYLCHSHLELSVMFTHSNLTSFWSRSSKTADFYGNDIICRLIRW